MPLTRRVFALFSLFFVVLFGCDPPKKDDGNVYPTFGPKKVGKDKAEITSRIDGLIADGQTALYDATAKAYDLAKGRAEKAPAQIHAVVVMTDGRDEGSNISLQDLTKRFGTPPDGQVIRNLMLMWSRVIAK